jgi:hypothetical protein
MHWAAKSWNSSGAVGDLRSRPSWPKVICREAPRLAPVVRPPAGDEGVCLLSSTATSDLQIERRPCGLVCQLLVRLHSEGRAPVKS